MNDFEINGYKVIVNDLITKPKFEFNNTLTLESFNNTVEDIMLNHAGWGDRYILEKPVMFEMPVYDSYI